MQEHPRVTLGIATYNRDAYLAEAIESCLAQDYPALEVLIVLDGSDNPRVDQVVQRYAADPRLRHVRHERNRGIAAAYSTLISEGRGELIAMLGDDDVCLPDRIARQVAIFDSHPETGVVHGDAIVIDATGRVSGEWKSADFTPNELVRSFYRAHNYLIDPSRMVHRRVYERVGGYDSRYTVAQDFDFWLRAARHFRFRHTPGGPLVKVRRHAENESGASRRDTEVADVSRALESALELYPLRELVPELDWPVLEPAAAERAALERLAGMVQRRALPLPELADTLRERAAAIPVPAPAPRNGRRLLMTMFGWNDSGGGTILPRLVAKELVRRGWEVSVFHAAVGRLEGEPPYSRREWSEDGVRLVGMFNRPSELFEIGNPARDLDDPVMRAAFARELEEFKPDTVHFHNLHNLSSALIDEAHVRGMASYFTTHNYWLICQRAYLMDGSGEMCPGPGDGARCAACVGSADTRRHQRRLGELRARVNGEITQVFAVSQSVRSTLIASGYDPSAVSVVRQAMPVERELWERVGRERAPGRRGTRLTAAFLGSAYPHKGPQLLVQAAQMTAAQVQVRIIGEVPAGFAQQLRELDRRGVVDFSGSYGAAELDQLLRDVDLAVLPSRWWDCAPLSATEARAARLPLVVPRLGGLPEVIRDGVDGLSFTALDAADLARVLDRLAQEDGLLERLQAAIETPADFAEHVDELEAWYRGERHPSTAEPPQATNVEVRWKGDHGLPTSLSIINDEVSRRLPGPLQRVTRDGQALDPPLSHAADVEIRHEWPPDLSVPPAGRLAAIVPWEFGAIPQDWVREIRANVDELWVPSEFVRRMYLEAGVAEELVHVIPNGVDLDTFRPAPAGAGPTHNGPVRFLYVGGITARKGPDLLIAAWDEAFSGRDDVLLVIKAALAGGAYGGPSEPLRRRAAAPGLPRVQLIEDDLDSAALAELYRSCDVFVLPYRGEGFAMPVLEAMASGLPVIVTGGGPTDEFCPPEAGWRIRAERREMDEERIGHLATVGRPWLLEPDRSHLVELLRLVAAEREQRERRGREARLAAQRLSWETVAQLYSARITELAGRPTRAADRPQQVGLQEREYRLKLLAAPVWRGEDQLPQLLSAWAEQTTPRSSACLYLLADAHAAGSAEQIEAHVLRAARRAGVDLDACADVDVLIQPLDANRDRRLHAGASAYLTLRPGDDPQARLALAAGRPVLSAQDPQLGELLRGSAAEAERS